MKEVEDLNQAFYAAIESADLDRMSEIWVDDVPDHLVAMCVHPGWPLLSGRGEVLRSWALIMANTPYIQFVLTDVQTTVLGNVAVLTCAENILTAADAEDVGDTGFAAGRVVATNTFVKTAGGWRLWHHHGSPVLQTSDDEEDEEAS